MTTATGLCAVYVLIVGTFIATTDWSGLGCFDGDEPACNSPVADSGLSVIQTSSWMIAVVAIGALIAAGIWSLRMRQPRGLLGVLALCALTFVAIGALYARL